MLKTFAGVFKRRLDGVKRHLHPVVEQVNALHRPRACGVNRCLRPVAVVSIWQSDSICSEACPLRCCRGPIKLAMPPPA